LLADHDVAYLRPGLTSRVAPVVSPPLVFVSPEPQGELTHRFPFQPALQAAVDEARAVQSALPGARLLTGEQATRKALLSSWETTGVVYVIGHVLRDPEVPFMVMIPAAPTPEARSSAYVEVADIRSMDLSRCGLVVLSGCSSGLPYAGQGAHAPSLAQACIDAGARSVVHTFWDIDDREASDLMTDFIDKRRNGMTTIRALAEAKRARMQSAGAGSFDWASYGILINSPELVQAENVSSARSR
jgi:CHAT domain-containing protein